MPGPPFQQQQHPAAKAKSNALLPFPLGGGVGEANEKERGIGGRKKGQNLEEEGEGGSQKELPLYTTATSPVRLLAFAPLPRRESFLERRIEERRSFGSGLTFVDCSYTVEQQQQQQLQQQQLFDPVPPPSHSLYVSCAFNFDAGACV